MRENKIKSFEKKPTKGGIPAKERKIVETTNK